MVDHGRVHTCYRVLLVRLKAPLEVAKRDPNARSSISTAVLWLIHEVVIEGIVKLSVGVIDEFGSKKQLQLADCPFTGFGVAVSSHTVGFVPDPFCWVKE